MIFNSNRRTNAPLITRTDPDGSVQREPRLNSRRDRKKDGEYHDYRSSPGSRYRYHREFYPRHRIFYWISWPNCCRPICYTWGPHLTFGYFWPYYHRKFVFISLGGYWPCYTYRRYYWYGWHPYRWYGDCPPEYVIAGNTYNYYYYRDDPPRQDALSQAQKRLEERPPAEPEQESQADRYFEEAVKAFEAGDYAIATAKFDDALKLAPDDIVLPFAYVQALFASGEYESAAEFLRKALIKVSPEKEGVFYPRGLYPNDSILQQQVEQLTRVVRLNPNDADLQLLLGYQLLGMGQLEEAGAHLQNARLDSGNSQAATLLINLLKKLKSTDTNNVSSNSS